MTSLITPILTLFLQDIDIFLIILVRILSFMLVIPILSGQLTTMAKVMFAVAFSFLLFSTGQVTAIAYDNSVPGYLMMIVKELFVGFTMGFSVYIIFNVFYFAGQLIDYQMGLSMVSVFDPILQIQVPIMGNVIYFFMAVILIQSGGLHMFISALSYSYQAVPVGFEQFFGNEALTFYIVNLMMDFFVIGVQLALPIVGTLLFIDIALGILVKTVPQMNVFVVGLPIKLLTGMAILYVTIPAFVDMFHYIYKLSYQVLSNTIGGMSP